MSKHYLQWYRDEVGQILRDASGEIGKPDLNSSIYRALDILSSAQPRYVVKDETGNGSTFEWAVPDDWEPNFSFLYQVECPAGLTSEREPLILDDSEYTVVRVATDTFKWRLLTVTPSTGQKVRFTYAARHGLTEISTTLKTRIEEQAVVCLAAAFAFRALGAFYSQATGGMIDADTVDYKSRASEFYALANEYEELSGLKPYLKKARLGEIALTSITVPHRLTTGDLPLTTG